MCGRVCCRVWGILFCTKQGAPLTTKHGSTLPDCHRDQSWRRVVHIRPDIEAISNPLQHPRHPRLHRPLRDILRIFLMEKLSLPSHPDLDDQPTVAIQKSSARSPDADPNTMHRTVANCRRRLDGAVEHTRNRTVHARLRWENIWQIINYVPPGSIRVRFHKKDRVCKEADTSFRMGFIRLCFRSSV